MAKNASPRRASLIVLERDVLEHPVTSPVVEPPGRFAGLIVRKRGPVHNHAGILIVDSSSERGAVVLERHVLQRQGRWRRRLRATSRFSYRADRNVLEFGLRYSTGAL